jgi:hypothetical protein
LIRHGRYGGRFGLSSAVVPRTIPVIRSSIIGLLVLPIRPQAVATAEIVDGMDHRNNGAHGHRSGKYEK